MVIVLSATSVNHTLLSFLYVSNSANLSYSQAVRPASRVTWAAYADSFKVRGPFCHRVVIGCGEPTP